MASNPFHKLIGFIMMLTLLIVWEHGTEKKIQEFRTIVESTAWSIKDWFCCPKPTLIIKKIDGQLQIAMRNIQQRHLNAILSIYREMDIVIE